MPPFSGTDIGKSPLPIPPISTFSMRIYTRALSLASTLHRSGKTPLSRSKTLISSSLSTMAAATASSTQPPAAPTGSAAGREAFRQAVVNTLERRLFYIPSFKIYRGVAGLYDYGPPGCAVKSNVLSFWRQVFVLLFSLALFVSLYLIELHFEWIVSLFCCFLYKTIGSCQFIQVNYSFTLYFAIAN